MRASNGWRGWQRASETPGRPLTAMASGVPRRILVVESHEDNREALRLVFSLLGYDVECASTGQSAVAITGTWKPDLVVLDLGLPDIPGERVAEAIKEMQSPPFIVGYSGFHRREPDARAAGCDAFVLKPNLDGLLTLVAVEMQRRVEVSKLAG